jgi:hypothetical protein
MLPELVLDTINVPLVVSELCPGQSSMCNNSKLRKDRVTVLCTAHLPNDTIYLHCFLFISLIVSELCPGQSSKCKYEQRNITSKLGKAEFRFLCTAHLPNYTYLPIKCIVHIYHTFRSISLTMFEV